MALSHLDVVRMTLQEVRRDPPLAAALFYGRLLTRRPGVPPTFDLASDPDGRRLLWTISMTLAGLADPQRFFGLASVFARSAGRAALNDREDAAAIGDALHWMLKHSLGEFYTRDVHDAWDAAYHQVSDIAGNPPLLPAQRLH